MSFPFYARSLTIITYIAFDTSIWSSKGTNDGNVINERADVSRIYFTFILSLPLSPKNSSAWNENSVEMCARWASSSNSSAFRSAHTATSVNLTIKFIHANMASTTIDGRKVIANVQCPTITERFRRRSVSAIAFYHFTAIERAMALFIFVIFLFLFIFHFFRPNDRPLYYSTAFFVAD